MRTRRPGNTRMWMSVIRIIVMLILSLIGRRPGKQPRTKSRPSRATRKPVLKRSGADDDIASLFARRQGDTVVTGEGLVVKILPDDTYDEDGSGQHQQFLVEVPGDLTIKVAHNLKFGRAPVREGDTIRFKGEYEWNERGGCVHWTHHDPKRWRDDGWIEVRGKRYG